MARRATRKKSAGEYAREAVSEWGNAFRYGVRALFERGRERSEKAPLSERLNPGKTDKGGRAGDAADAGLSKLGLPGKLASKVSLGSRIIERLRPGDEGGGSAGDQRAGDQSKASGGSGAGEGDANGARGAGGRVPLEQSIDVALSVRGAYELITRFEDYPKFLDRVEEAEEIDESHVAFAAKLRRSKQELEVEIIDERSNERIDWECKDPQHSGVVSFHELAPRLTHLEVTVEADPGGPLDRLSHALRLDERALREELHRLKAYADLWEEDVSHSEEAEEEEAADEPEAEREAPEEESEGEPEDEEYVDDEEDFADEEDFEDEEEAELEDEELEPAR